MLEFIFKFSEISRNLREVSTNHNYLAIPSHPKQGLDIGPLDYNNSTPLRSYFFCPSHLGFCYPWLNPVLQVVWHTWSRRVQYRRYESTYILFYKGRRRRNRIYLLYARCRRCIHCAGWFFTFPSSDEAILWRVSSAVLTGIAFLLPLFLVLLASLKTSRSHDQLEQLAFYVLIIILLVYVVSRLFLLVEAFISLRHLNPGMLALVKWTSFLPHI